MIMRFSWLSWKPPEISPEAELQLAQTLAIHGKGNRVSAFLGFSESRFFAVHGTGLFYLGGTVVCAFFNSFVAALFGIGFVIYYLSIPIALFRYNAWLNCTERKYCLPAKATRPNTQAPPDDNPFYEAVADEMEQERLDKVVWTRAIANSAGDEKLAKSLYIRYRVQTLSEARAQQAREQHQAQVLERERQKQHEREAQQAAACKQAEERDWGFLRALGVIAFSAIVIVGLIVWVNSSAPTNTLQAASQPIPQPQSQSDISSLAITPQHKLAELQTEYDALTKRRAALDLKNSDQVSVLNNDVAEYHRKLKKAQTDASWRIIQDDWQRTQRENAEQHAKWLKQHQIERR